jgi:hypothetical protein
MSRSTRARRTVTGSIISLRYRGECAACHVELERSSRAEWDRERRVVTCLDCVARRNATVDAQTRTGDADSKSDSRSAELEGATEPLATPPSTPLLDVGVAGAAAAREFARRSAKRDRAIETKFGRLAPIVKFLSDEPQTTTAWKRGAEGEETMAASFARRLGDRAVVLHDRSIPKSRANIDHLVVARSGVWVVDTKRYDGKLEKRTAGMFSSRRNELWVEGRNRTSLCDGVRRQVEVVQSKMPVDNVPVRGVLCFVGAEWEFFASPFSVSDVLITSGKRLAKTILETSVIDDAAVESLARHLSIALPSKES